MARPRRRTSSPATRRARKASSPTASKAEPTENEETILGIDPESILAIAAGVLSLLLAFLVWTRPAWRWPVVITAVVMFAFLLLDIREIAHQVDESRTSVAIAATVVALLHGAAVLAAILLFARREPSVGGAPAPPAAS